MASFAESLNAESPLNALLAVGTETISSQQEVTFVQYIKFTSPIDGMVYWVESGSVKQLYQNSIPNSATGNTAMPNTPLQRAVTTLVAKGSLHFLTEFKQEEDAQYGKNRVMFTSETIINDFNAIGPTTIYIAQISGFMYAFSSQKSFYQQANTYHYVGDAVYPMMLSQIVTSASLINNLVISNSLPLWLNIASSLGATIYPSYVSLPNRIPPYITCHVGETDTISMQPIASRMQTYNTDLSGNLIYPLQLNGSGHWQLYKDSVRLTLWGFSNNAAITFLDGLYSYFENDNGTMGLMSAITLSDAKKTQHELQIIGQKKVIALTVSYYQTNAYVQALSTIQSALFSVYLGV